MALGSASIAEPELPALPLHAAVPALLKCARNVMIFIFRRRIDQPLDYIGQCVSFADGSTSEVYRETIIEHSPVQHPAVLVVCFRLRGVRTEWQHALFRRESELNTLLFAGFPGFVSKLWLKHDQSGLYRGLYQWDDPEQAISYVRSLWWVLALVSHRDSIHYAVLPGLDRDQMLSDPGPLDALVAARGGWWRPVEGGAAAT